MTESVLRAAFPVLRLTIRTNPSVAKRIRIPGESKERAASRAKAMLIKAAGWSSGNNSLASAQEPKEIRRKENADCRICVA